MTYLFCCSKPNARFAHSTLRVINKSGLASTEESFSSMREFGTAESVRRSLEEDWDCMELDAGLPAYKRDCTRVILEAPLDR